VDLRETSPDAPDFTDWCEVWTASGLAERPDDPPRPAGDHVALGRALLRPGGSRDGTHRSAVVDGRVVGALRLLLPLHQDRSTVSVDLAVHPGSRRRGVGTALLAEARNLAALAGRTDLIAEVDEPGPGAPGRAVAEHHGWACSLLETRRDLVLPPDEDRLCAVEAEAAAASPDDDVVTWTDRTPDALAEDRALLESRMSTDAPHGDLPLQEQRWDAARLREHEAAQLARGRTVLSAGAVHDGRLVAFTDLLVPLDDRRLAHQGATLVLREHRGRRLGARVKAAVLRELAVAHPGVQRIATTNAEHNTAMVAVNEALGFVRAGELSVWTTRL
jgi:GNAT superfamily N-acetyltransferase